MGVDRYFENLYYHENGQAAKDAFERGYQEGIRRAINEAIEIGDDKLVKKLEKILREPRS